MNAHIDVTGVVLTTSRLTLRPWKESDLEDFYEYARVDGVGQMAGWKPHDSMEESSVILQMFLKGKKTFALEFQGKVVGSVGIEEYKEENYPELAQQNGREIGYVLSKEHWGRGLMTEAVQAVIRYLLESVKLDFILVGHFDHNSRSKRVVEKNGFTYMKTIPYTTQFDTVETCLEYILLNPERSKNYADS